MTARHLAVAAALAWSLDAHAAADAFLCTPDTAVPPQAWNGESSDSQYRNCEQFEWLGFGAALDPAGGSGGPGTPPSVLGPLVFGAKVDSLTPTLLSQLLTGTVFAVDLYIRPPGKPYWTTKVSYADAVISDLQAVGAGEVPDLTVSIRARTITWTSRTYDTGGTMTGETTVTWTAPGP